MTDTLTPKIEHWISIATHMLDIMASKYGLDDERRALLDSFNAITGESWTPTEVLEDPIPVVITDDNDANFDVPLVTCGKCGIKAVAFICDVKGCPVNGGAFHG